MKHKRKVTQLKIRILRICLIAFVGLSILSCDKDDDLDPNRKDTRLEGRDLVLSIHQNPKTKLDYTLEEIAALDYTPGVEEYYTQWQTIKIYVWAQQKPNKIEISKEGSDEIITTLTAFSRKDRPDVSKYKEGYGYESRWTTSMADLKIPLDQSQTYTFKVTYYDQGIDGFLTPSVRNTNFKINHYDDGSGGIDLATALVGDWRFDDAANLVKATKGNDLILAGGKSHSAVAGIADGDGAALIDLGSRYEVNHGIPATSGSTKISSYSIIMDVNVPTASVGKYVNLIQTRPENDGDGSVYINPGLGFWFNGGPSSFNGTIKADTWHRIVVSVDAPDFKLYVDGTEIYANSDLGGKAIQKLDPLKFFLFADNGGEDYPIKVSQVMLFNQGFLGDQIKGFPKVGEQFE